MTSTEDLNRTCIKLTCPKPSSRWSTPARNSQSNSTAVSPSGRYFFVAYLYGLDVLDTKTGKEVFYTLHHRQDRLGFESQFNIFGYIPITDTMGYTMERSAPIFGDFWLRRVEFNFARRTFKMDRNPRVLERKVKCLTVSWDVVHWPQVELCIVMRQARHQDDDAASNEPAPLNSENRFCAFFGYDNGDWTETRPRISMNKLAQEKSWDWYPRFVNGYLYVFPVGTNNNQVSKHLEELGKIARVNPSNGEFETIHAKNSLDWMLDNPERYNEALFVDNMDYRWIADDLYLLFVVAIRDRVQRNRTPNYKFVNILANFNLTTLRWKKLELGPKLCCGEQSPNPYRMQVTPNNQMIFLVTSRAHPCTIYGTRPQTPRKRLLWTQLDDSSGRSQVYRVSLPARSPPTLQQLTRAAVIQEWPELVDINLQENWRVRDFMIKKNAELKSRKRRQTTKPPVPAKRPRVDAKPPVKPPPKPRANNKATQHRLAHKCPYNLRNRPQQPTGVMTRSMMRRFEEEQKKRRAGLRKP